MANTRETLEVRRGPNGEYTDVYAVGRPDCWASTAFLGWTVEEREAHACAIAAIPDLLTACELAANRPAEVQAMMRREGFVIDDLEDRWQKFAFTLYTMLVGNATQAQAAIDAAREQGGEEEE